MRTGKIIKNLAEYNTWANTQIIKWFQDADPKLFNQKIPSSFATVKSTFLHILNAERYWLSFLKNEDMKPFLDEYNGNMRSFFDTIIQQSEAFENFVNSLTVESMEQIHEIDTTWLKGEQPCYVYIQHVINHSTYHRGQLITLGRILGMENPPNTDYAKYVIAG